MKNNIKYKIFKLCLCAFLFCIIGCAKEKVIAVKHVKVEINRPVVFKNYYTSNEEVVLKDYNTKSKHYNETILRMIYVQKFVLISGDQNGVECDGCSGLTLQNITSTDMNVTFQLGNKTETALIKANDQIVRNDFPNFCAQPDLRIISFEYL